MNLETVADELYALLPSEFTAARDARARTARREGDRELANRISGLGKPTLSAWAANLLVRERPDDTARFLALGEQLRRAYQELDGAQLRELARTQRQLTQALSRSARDAAADAGRPIGHAAQREVEQTLQAVLADPESAARWSAGRLAKPLTPPTAFSSTGLAAESPRPSRPSRPSEPKRRTAKVSDLEDARDRRRLQQEKADEARRTADEAAEEGRRTEAERAASDDDLTRAKDHRKAADQRLTAAREELREAERDQRTAADAERQAQTRAKDAARAAHEAERAARRARREADRLTPHRRKR